MATAPPHVSAAQVLDAGRRAEAEGRIEYAMQFYRHLADNHGSDPEAMAARDALSRLGMRKRPGTLEEPAATRSMTRQPPRVPTAGRPPLTPVPAPPRGVSSLRIAPVGAGEPPSPLILPEPVGGYRTGRLIAHGLATVGIVLMLVGLVLGAAGLLPSGVLPGAGQMAAALHPAVGPLAIAAGVLLVLVSQLARAVFDIARSTRDLAAIERAKVEHRNGDAR